MGLTLFSANSGQVKNGQGKWILEATCPTGQVVLKVNVQPWTRPLRNRPFRNGCDSEIVLRNRRPNTTTAHSKNVRLCSGNCSHFMVRGLKL